ncbi:hypothetical protein [Embleya sp. NPDC020886]|uniref:hypothetical protein n=1 Tax=Embleya sp. NPDC020886 TaxID=3363980 RepID=UPI003797B634
MGVGRRWTAIASSTRPRPISMQARSTRPYPVAAAWSHRTAIASATFSLAPHPWTEPV